MKTISKNCPESCIVFVSFGRKEIASKSYESLRECLEPYRERIRIIISDATNDEEKINWAMKTDADDLILTPRFTSAATSRNLAVTLLLDKYSPQYLCLLEDDFMYHVDWYGNLVDYTKKLYGVMSPFNLAYGVFSASEHHIPKERCILDQSHNVKAYIFGAVAYQRFMPLSHYLSVMKHWDSDLLGISYAQTGSQTFRNTMRGFCGAILPGRLSWPLDTDSNKSTWSKGKRNPGPPAHSFNLSDYEVIQEEAKKTGFYKKDEE